MPISLRSSRKDLVERSLSRIRVSLCCTSGWVTTVTPSMTRFLTRSRYRAVAGDAQRRRAIGPALMRNRAPGRPRSALEHAGEREGHGILAEPPANTLGQPIEQRHDQRRTDLMLAPGLARVAQDQHARVDEQPTVAVLGKAGQAIDVRHLDA